MRSSHLAAAIALVLGSISFNAAAQSTPSADDLAMLRAQVEALQARLADLEQRTDAQSDINLAQAKTNESLDDVASLKKLVNDTKISGRMYFDATNINDTNNGTKTSKSGFGFDIKRFYLGVDHKFNDTWSMNLTTDFQYSSAISATELYIKKAYVQYKYSDAFVLRAGSTDLPWVPFSEGANGMRYVENTMVDRLKYGTSADWGLHASGKLAGGAFEYAGAMLNGSGYKNTTRSKGVDFEGRVSYAPTDNVVIGVGGYTGTLGKETQTVNSLHTANRVDALVAYTSGNTRLGVEYFQATNWGNVLTAASDKADGYSLWGSMGLTNGGITLFGRYDNADLSKRLDPSLRESYFNVGIEFPIIKGVKLATVYKQTHRQNDTSVDLENKEIGVWGEFRF